MTKSCRHCHFFLASDTRNLPRAVPHSLGHPPWRGDVHAGDEQLLAVTWHFAKDHPKSVKREPK